MSPRGLALGFATLSAIALAFAFIVDPSNGWPWVVPIMTSLGVGAVLTYRLPGNRVGWLLLLFGVGGATTGLTRAIALTVEDLTVAGWIDTAGYVINTPAVVYSIGAILLRFPDGRLLSPRWRWVEYALVLAAAMGSAAALLNGGWGGDPQESIVPSPLREVVAPAGDILSAIFIFVTAAAWLSCAGSAIARFRSSTGEVRLQMKWLASAAGLVATVALLVLSLRLVTGDTRTVATGWLAVLIALSFSALPVATAVAILKYRLYEIDVAISRTVVLAVLAGFITATYALVVVGLGALIGGDSDDLVLPIAATALVALAFEPVRLRAQHWANRLVYGNRATPYEVLSDLTGRLSAAEAGEGILDRMAEMLREGTGADRATIWLGKPGEMSPQATSPVDVSTGREPPLDDVTGFPVHHDGEVVGALEVVKPRGTALSTSERSLVTDLAGSAGAVLGYQQLNDSLAQRAGELEASRQRLVEAQGLERRRLERELHEGAEQYIVALKVKLGVATQLARRQGASDLEGLLDGLTGEAQAALDDVRSLAKGIYPPVLESDGLGAAVSALATSTPVAVQVKRDGIGRYPLDVEAAVYFDISEAVTNAVKHAEAPIIIELAESTGELHFSVRDSGPGFELDTHEPGSGLENMADRMNAIGGRLRVVTSPGSYTEVSGSVPVHSDVNTDGSNSDLETKATAPAASALD